MQTLTSRIKKRLHGNRTGLLLFAVLSLATGLFLTVSQGAVQHSGPGETANVLVSAKLSQHKIVQGEEQTLYLDIVIKAPTMDKIAMQQRATDMIVILDRSGSMSSAEKMPYAKAAVQDILSRLHDSDRFALISFANRAIVHTPLLMAGAEQRASLSRMVAGIRPAGGTNIGDGLQAALGMLNDTGNGRSIKVLLLSDGRANQGITQPAALAHIAARLNRYGAVLSTIGMGLDFNETLLTTLADYGMGHYAYLEDLTGLGQVLAGDLQQTRRLYASSSSLHIDLADGVQVLDAGGYPVTRNAAGGIDIATGQLLADTDKHFIITLRMPASAPGILSLGNSRLLYQVQGNHYQQPLSREVLQVSVVAPERRQEAVASIDHGVYQYSWLKNNLGRMQRRLSKWLREGKKDPAEKTIREYREAVSAASAAGNAPLPTAKVEDRLDALESQVQEAFSGKPMAQEVKRKRAAKSIHYGAIVEQRASQ